MTQQADKLLNDIGRNSLLGNRKKIAKFLMQTSTCRSTFLYGLNTEQDYNGIISLAELDFPILISAYRKKKN